jgi:hypothetical protein
LLQTPLLHVFRLQAAHKAAEAMKRQIAAQFGISLRPLQALQQQQDAEHGSSTTTAAAGTCGDGCAEGPEQKQQQVHMSSYKTGVAAPVTAVMLTHQARAAAIALLRCVELLFRKCLIGARCNARLMCDWIRCRFERVLMWHRSVQQAARASAVVVRAVTHATRPDVGVIRLKISPWCTTLLLSTWALLLLLLLQV